MFTPWIGLRNTALKTDKISTSWQASYRHTIATCNFRNFTSNEKSCTGFVLIVSIFLSVWPHTKNHKFLRIVYKRLPCDPRSLSERLSLASFWAKHRYFLSDPSGNSWPNLRFFFSHSGITSQFGSTVIYLRVATNTFILKVLLC